MANSFARTARSLSNETSAYAVLLWGLAGIALAAWLAWFLFVKVTVYELSRTARLQVLRATHPVAAPIAGTITRTSLQLGKHVRAGDALVEMDTQRERLQLAEEEARQKTIPDQQEALRKQIHNEELALQRARVAATKAVEQARSRHQEASAAAQFATERSQRLGKLAASGRIAAIDALHARSEALRSDAAATAHNLDIGRLASEATSKEHEKLAALDGLRRELASLEGQRAISTATIARLQQALEQHIIRAPVSGVVGDITANDVGAYLNKGQVMANIVPSGTLKIVAEFEPSSVLGRVHAGQSARLRLDAFPWTQYGTIPAQVDRVASEIRDGHVRVELLPRNTSKYQALLQHGLLGSVEIEIERTTPVVLVLRAAGHSLGRSAKMSNNGKASTS